MKTFVLLTALTLGALFANDVVTYDTHNNNQQENIKVNHPNQDLY
ncbi:MAG: hypothetical protein WCR69_01205 [Sulfuricurvum sp.]|jgi:hypothetical protein